MDSTTAGEHVSDSAAQRGAEAAIREQLASDLGTALVPGGRFNVGGQTYVQVDGRSEDGRLFVEIYARQGALKGGQLKNIGQDIRKLALIRRQPGFENAQVMIAFASPEALGSVRGWMAVAAADFGVELRAVTLTAQLREALLEAQGALQVMVNPS